MTLWMRVLCVAVLIAACSSPKAASTVKVSITPPPPDPSAPVMRLPGDVVPIRYALELTVVPAQPTASGTITITTEVLEPTRAVWLNASELTIGKATLDGKPARVLAGGDDIIGLTVEREITPGPLAIEIAFTAPIHKGASAGIYSAREAVEGGDNQDDNEYAYTYFQPIAARRAFPCFDEPSAKVPWKLSLLVKEDHVALGNAPIENELAAPDGMKRVEFAETKPLPAHLVAFAVGPFELVEGGSAGKKPTPIQFAIPKGRAAELGYLKRVTPSVLAALEDHVAMEYPFDKLDIAIVPRQRGTMEHPGLVAVGQPVALIRPEQETRERTWLVANTVAHELGQSWFGDYVTMAWWDDAWLTEGAGRWLDLAITEAVEPAFHAFDRRPARTAYAAAADETISTRALRQAVTTRDDVADSFDRETSSDKGAAVLRMFEQYVGPDRWRAAMQSFLVKHAWGNASADQLLASLALSIGEPTAASVRTFLDQPGIPEVAGTLTCEEGAAPVLELTQTRSLLPGSVDEENRLWSIPVCVRYGVTTSTRECTLLEAAKGSMRLGQPGDACPAWVMLNAGGDGYYRSVIDPAQVKQWFTAGKVRTAAQPTVAERLTIVNDLLAMSHREELPIDQRLALVPIVAADPDERVARSAIELASFARDELDDIAKEKAGKFTARTFGSLAKKLGWSRGRRDSQERHDLRVAVLRHAAQYDARLAKQATTLARKWLDKRTGLDDELVPAALWVAARAGDRAWFDAAVAAANAARDRDEQRRILASLGALRDPALLAAALEITRGADFDLRESVGILTTALADPETYPAAVAFAIEHLPDLLPRLRDDEAASLLAAVASAACNVQTVAKVAAAITPLAKKYAGAQLPVARGLETARACAARAARVKPVLEAFLARY